MLSTLLFQVGVRRQGALLGLQEDVETGADAGEEHGQLPSLAGIQTAYSRKLEDYSAVSFLTLMTLSENS